MSFGLKAKHIYLGLRNISYCCKRTIFSAIKFGNKSSDSENNSDASKSNELNNLLNDATEFIDWQPQHVEDVWISSPYPKSIPHPEHDLSKRNKSANALDPSKTSVILFPGQGVQFVGMGQQLLQFPNVKEMFHVANDVLGYDLLDLCLHGPIEKLNKTMFCQPATVVTSLAAVQRLKDERPHILDTCVATAGFSVGEITALIFAGALSFEDGLKLVKVRAEAMQAAAEIDSGGLMTVFFSADNEVKLACHVAKKYCQKLGMVDADCRIANYLFPGCKVIGGNTEALEFIKENSSDFKIRRYKMLPVSGAFHTRLMVPAVEVMKTFLKTITIEDPIISVHSNVDGKSYRGKEHIIKQLPSHIINPVKWEQTLHVIYERQVDTEFPQTFACGPGSSLKLMLEKVNLKAAEHCVSIPT